jgi:anti-sigma B factor antagonist
MADKPTISIQPHDQVVLAVVQLKALDDATASRLQDEVATAADGRGEAPVVLDMTMVEYVPSLGLGALVTLMRRLRQSGHRLMLTGVHPDVRGALAVTRLDKLFEIHPRTEDAVARLRETK